MKSVIKITIGNKSTVHDKSKDVFTVLIFHGVILTAKCLVLVLYGDRLLICGLRQTVY